MATEKRLIDGNALKLKAWPDDVTGEGMVYVSDIDDAPTVDAVEVHRLGKLGKLMMPYTGCPRGMIGERGDDGTGYHLTELDAITDVDGNRWVPVLENDLSRLKAKAEAVEVAHGRWNPRPHHKINSEGRVIKYCDFYYCSECGTERPIVPPYNYCPNCGAKMDGDGNG